MVVCTVDALSTGIIANVPAISDVATKIGG